MNAPPAAPESGGAAGETSRFAARVAGMHCAGCVTSVERAVAAVPGVESAEVNLVTGDLSVRLAGAPPPETGLAAEIARALEAAGPYRLETAAPASAGGSGEAASAESRGWRDGLSGAAVALALAFGAMGVAMSGIGPTSAGRFLQFALATPVCLGLGAAFLRALWTGLRHGSFSMDSLIGLGAGAAYGSSLVVLLSGAGGALFFDTAALILAIVRLGRWLEERARRRAKGALTDLLSLAPETARVVRGDEERLVPVAEVERGERIRLRPGERAPLDGRIVAGGASLDESLVTGESVPVERAVSDPVVAGALNLNGSLEIEVSRPAAESTVSRIAAAVARAQAGKIPVQRAADRVAGVFVPVVMAGAALTAALWFLAGGGAEFALARGVAVLVVACPCAIGLAAPIAVLVATGESARRGVLFRSAEALEALAGVRVVGLDKTGTVTTGVPAVVTIEPAPGWTSDELLRFAASAEQGSEHPLGSALVRHARGQGHALRLPERFEALPGRGVTARFGDGARAWVGSERLLRERGFEAPRDPDGGASGRLRVLRERNGRTEFAGSIGFRDQPRPEARELVRSLGEAGLRVTLISGDDPAAVAAVGAEVGVRDTEGGLLPEEKLAAVNRLRDRYGPVAMVGDGINDAPALSRADVGVALAQGTGIARESAGVTLMRPDLRLVSVAVRLARRSLRIIRQNLFWAFVYNVAALPLAAGALYPTTGLLMPPEAAAGAMALSSLSVVGNALRLKIGA